MASKRPAFIRFSVPLASNRLEKHRFYKVLGALGFKKLSFYKVFEFSLAPSATDLLYVLKFINGKLLLHGFLAKRGWCTISDWDKAP